MAAIDLADAAATREHPALVFVVEAPWAAGPKVGERRLVYEAVARTV